MCCYFRIGMFGEEYCGDFVWGFGEQVGVLMGIVEERFVVVVIELQDVRFS